MVRQVYSWGGDGLKDVRRNPVVDHQLPALHLLEAALAYGSRRPWRAWEAGTSSIFGGPCFRGVAMGWNRR